PACRWGGSAHAREIRHGPDVCCHEENRLPDIDSQGSTHLDDLEVVGDFHPTLLQHDGGGTIFFGRQRHGTLDLFLAQLTAADTKMEVDLLEDGGNGIGTHGTEYGDAARHVVA